jgi:hypothetical protein
MEAGTKTALSLRTDADDVHGRLIVRLNDGLVLDAGTCETVSGPSGLELQIRPPAETLFHQVLAYLRAKPDPPQYPCASTAGREGIAAAAVVLRFGSYLAVLLDRDKPLGNRVPELETSRIRDDEIARINTEASAGFAEWIDLLRDDHRLYDQLVNRALAYLPMVLRPLDFKSIKLNGQAFLDERARADLFAQWYEASMAAQLQRIRADCERFPSRIFANALVNVAWNQGPLEKTLAGDFRGYSLDKRRFTPAEERELMSFASEALSRGIAICRQFATEQPRRPWPEQVLPYGLAHILLVTPQDWSLTESSSEIRLPVAT